MNREIKFRAWNTKENRMYFPDGVWALANGHIETFESYGSHLILEQFTGLHDKNGKEIYEGDIVEYDTPGGTYRGIVSYQQALTAYYLIYIRPNSEPDLLHSVQAGVEPILEVIGNIHENPDLLK